jgi:tetratricopeptide (TPR) repeat protein
VPRFAIYGADLISWVVRVRKSPGASARGRWTHEKLLGGTMIHQLTSTEFERARELFGGFDYSLSIQAAVDHLAELGWYNYRRGEYAQCVQYYEQVFTLREENPDYYYHLAASAWALLGNGAKALSYLEAAANHGWSNTAYTREQEEFSFIRDTREWNSILALMEAN